MKRFKMPVKKMTALELAREDALKVLATFDPIDEKDKYAQTLKYVSELSHLIAAEAAQPLSKNTVFLGATNVFIAFIIVSYESRHVLSTKVLPFMAKITE